MYKCIRSLAACSVFVDSPVCPVPCVCIVTTTLTVFPWQCLHDDTQTHTALGVSPNHILFCTHLPHLKHSHKYTHTHTCIIFIRSHLAHVTHLMPLKWSNLTHRVHRWHASYFTHSTSCHIKFVCVRPCKVEKNTHKKIQDR